MFVLIKSWMSLKMGQVGSTLEKPCEQSRGHIFSPIIMKLGQNVCLDEILDGFKMGHVWSKTRSYSRKTLCNL